MAGREEHPPAGYEGGAPAYKTCMQILKKVMATFLMRCHGYRESQITLVCAAIASRVNEMGFPVGSPLLSSLLRPLPKMTVS